MKLKKIVSHGPGMAQWNHQEIPTSKGIRYITYNKAKMIDIIEIRKLFLYYEM